MKPIIPIVNAANPTFIAVNDAKVFAAIPFDPASLNWTSASNAAQQGAALANFRLGLTYSATAATQVFAPSPGRIVSVIGTNATTGAFERQLLYVYADEGFVSAVRRSGRNPDLPPPPAGSMTALPWDHVAARVLEIRFVFSTLDAAIADKLRQRMLTLFANGNGTLKRQLNAEWDLEMDAEGNLNPIEIGAGPPETKLFTPWWNGQSKAYWDLTGNNDDLKILDLANGESIVVQAQVRAGLPGSATDHWFLVNVGCLIRASGMYGDPLDIANDPAYGKACDDFFRRISTGGTIESNGTNPAGRDELTFNDVIALYNSSQDAVAFQPPADRVVPGCLFSFISADDITLFSPKLENASVGARLWQPTFTSIDMSAVAAAVTAAQGIASDVFVPPGARAILGSEYGMRGNARRYPRPATKKSTFGRETFLEIMDRSYGYDDTRSIPPANVQMIDVGRSATWSRLINLNENPALRPEHPRWIPKNRGETFPTLRRLYPLRLEWRLGTDDNATALATIEQDEVDCIRQEYVFHLCWTGDYYQTYATQWNAQKRGRLIFTTPNHRIGVDNQNKVIPALTAERRFAVQPRKAFRFDPQWGSTRYTYTLLLSDYRNYIDRAQTVAEGFAQRVRAILASAPTLNAIRAARDAGTAYNDPAIPSYAAKIVATIEELVSLPHPPADQTRAFLKRALEQQDVMARIAPPIALMPTSTWRPPEHNESPSKTPISNHQLAEAFDVAPQDTRGPTETEPARRNPLSILCLHLAGLHLRYNTGELRELLLENNAQEYLSESYDEPREGQTITPRFNADGSVAAYIRSQPGSADEDILDYTEALDDGEVIMAGSASMSPGACDDFLNAYRTFSGSAINGLVWPNPAPTYRDMYIFALTNASHVHFTWNI